tara:strand:+ start:653 stop:883 length:231 start_codon:yes stop_codon:yes gene_type:complete
VFTIAAKPLLAYCCALVISSSMIWFLSCLIALITLLRLQLMAQSDGKFEPEIQSDVMESFSKVNNSNFFIVPTEVD